MAPLAMIHLAILKHKARKHLEAAKNLVFKFNINMMIILLFLGI